VILFDHRGTLCRFTLLDDSSAIAVPITVMAFANRNTSADRPIRTPTSSAKAGVARAARVAITKHISSKRPSLLKVKNGNSRFCRKFPDIGDVFPEQEPRSTCEF
jgi:hypothetical protein